MRLTRLVYFSRNRLGTSQGTLSERVSELLTAAVANNRKVDISGGLIFNADYFLQVLEGDRITVMETYARIERDTRHSGVEIIESKSVDTRLFSYWWMAAAGLSEDNTALFTRYCGTPAFDPHQLDGTAACSLIADVLRQQLHSPVPRTAPPWLSAWRTRAPEGTLPLDEFAA
jgi:hypothetical protein